MASIKDAAAWLADKANLRKQEDRLDDVRRHALLDYPFLGDKAIRSILRLNPKIKTACTDGRRVEFSPLFTSLLTMSELLFVFLHELLHIALCHHARRGERNAALWNQACDYVVNRILVAAGLQLPVGALFNPEYDELSEEEICSLLEKEANGKSKRPPEEGEDVGEPGGGGSEEDESEDESEDEGTNDCEEENEEDDDPNDGEDEEEDSRITPEPGLPTDEGEGEDSDDDPGNDGEGGYDLPDPSEWGEVEDLTNDDGTALTEEERSKELVKQAVENESAKRVGNMIGDGEGSAFADALDGAWKKSRYDWAAELDEFVTRCFSGDPEGTWSRGNRRFIGDGLYLPGRRNEGIGRIAVLSDASGSVGNDEFDLGLSQCEKIINDLPQEPEAVVWIQFDDTVRSAQVFENGARFENPERNGYGGTLIGPALKWLEDSGEEYSCIVILTDMGIFDWEEVRVPECPVVWADTWGSSAEPPFGKHIRITAE